MSKRITRLVAGLGALVLTALVLTALGLHALGVDVLGSWSRPRPVDQEAGQEDGTFWGRGR